MKKKKTDRKRKRKRGQLRYFCFTEIRPHLQLPQIVYLSNCCTRAGSPVYIYLPSISPLPFSLSNDSPLLLYISSGDVEARRQIPIQASSMENSVLLPLRRSSSMTKLQQRALFFGSDNTPTEPTFSVAPNLQPTLLCGTSTPISQ